jgi:hypothetical protein
VVCLVALFSVIASFILHYVAGFSLHKSLWIAGGAGAAMILFDVVFPMLFKKDRS